MPDLEDRLVEWVRQERVSEHAVHPKRIKEKALSLHHEMGIVGKFLASTGWVARFIKRKGLVRRSTTSTGKQIPANAQEVAKRFMINIRTNTNRLQPSMVANMDEVPCYFDIPRHHTVDFQGFTHNQGEDDWPRESSFYCGTNSHGQWVKDQAYDNLQRPDEGAK